MAGGGGWGRQRGHVYGDRELPARVMGFDESAGLVGTSNLERWSVKGAGTVVVGCGRGAGDGNDITLSWRELGQAVWHGLATWHASARVRARGRAMDG